MSTIPMFRIPDHDCRRQHAHCIMNNTKMIDIDFSALYCLLGLIIQAYLSRAIIRTLVRDPGKGCACEVVFQP